MRRTLVLASLLIAAPYLFVMGSSGYLRLTGIVFLLSLRDPILAGVPILLLAPPLVKILSSRWGFLGVIEGLIDHGITILLIASMIIPIIQMVFGVGSYGAFLSKVFSAAAILITMFPARLALSQLVDVREGEALKALLKSVEVHLMVLTIAFATSLPPQLYPKFGDPLPELGGRYALAIIYLNLMAGWMLTGIEGLKPFGRATLNYMSSISTRLSLEPWVGACYAAGAYLLIAAEGGSPLDEEKAVLFLKSVAVGLLLIYVVKQVSIFLISADALSGYLPWALLALFAALLGRGVRR